jgi:D-lactate dehydrogenase
MYGGERGCFVKVAVFSAKPYDRSYLEDANLAYGHELTFYEARLTPETCRLAHHFPAVCVFVSDELTRPVLTDLFGHGTRMIALRCAGFNNVDLCAAQDLGMQVANVPAYSPYAVAEHTVALILALNRKIYRAYNKVREGDFSLQGLEGFDLYNKTVGIIGTGKIGTRVANIMRGFGCQLLAYDPFPSQECRAIGVRYVEPEELLASSDIITLHCPLTPQSHHMINEAAIHRMKDGVMIINTSRGAILDTRAVIQGLKSHKVGYLGIDVYEEESDLFFENLSDQIIQDDVFSRLLTFPNVLITGHQAFFTKEALRKLAQTTLSNITCFEQGKPCPNALCSEQHYQRPCKT